MKLIRAPRPVFVLLFTAIALVLSSLFQSIFKKGIMHLLSSNNSLYVFLLCLVIILAIFVGDNGPPIVKEAESSLPFLSNSAEDADASLGEVEDNGSNNKCNSDDHVNGNEDDEREDPVYDSDDDGYTEDDEDTDDGTGRGDTADESDDDNLWTRVEDFIDRVYKGWQEEKFQDSLCNPLQFFSYISPL